uniref:Transposase n=1 Tax=Mesocestoides corti TaxID=53468 RepID=A0A5K3G2T0_MESCO
IAFAVSQGFEDPTYNEALDVLESRLDRLIHNLRQRRGNVFRFGKRNIPYRQLTTHEELQFLP